jgi:hypothetical protein
MAGALIVTAEMDGADFAWFERLRRAHYPPQRNQVPAHLTIIRSLPPSADLELRRRLSQAVHRARPRAMITGLIDLGGGVAFRIGSDDLEAVREELSEDLHGLLSQQDGPGWVPHVTIQNKVAPKTARALKQELERSFTPRALGIAGLAIHRYLGGPWEKLGLYPFRY